MDKNLIRSFRNKINEKELILHIFRNRWGKNKWSIICSAMDWIEVSLDGIDVSSLSRENDNRASIKMITFLSCIDIMWEAIQQLHRVLVDNRSIPYKEDFSVFNESVPDNIFFKTIRACFAAHPINLNGVYPDDEKDEKWYASWSGGTFSNKDFSVILYSNNAEKESRFFDVSFIEIYQFAEKRYKYLKDLMKQVDSIIAEYLESYRLKTIPVGNDELETIEILLAENKKRFDSDYFDYELKKIRMAFEVEPYPTNHNKRVMGIYRDALKFELSEISQKLQSMELEDLEYQINNEMPSELLYSFSKLSDAVWQGQYCMLFDYIMEKLKTVFTGIIDFDDNMSQEEVYVLACAGAYVINNQ